MNTQTDNPPEKHTEETFLDQHALNVMGIISRSSQLSQREVAQKAGISVGLVNLAVKRLVQTGYLKVINFNSRKAEYLLTPKGISEMSSRSYQYVVKTVRTYQEFCRQAKKMILNLKAKGHRQFVVLGEGEIADLILLTLRGMEDPSVSWRQESGGNPQCNGEMALDCRTGDWENSPGISVLSELLL
jgi:ribosomal protein S25